MNKTTEHEIGRIVILTTKIESCLEDLGAEGKGMHEKMSSIESKLSDDLVKKLRYIASVRNKTVHQHVPVERFEAFEADCEKVINELNGDHLEHSAYSSDVSNSDTAPNADSDVSVDDIATCIFVCIFIVLGFWLWQFINNDMSMEEIKINIEGNNSKISRLNNQIGILDIAIDREKKTDWKNYFGIIGIESAATKALTDKRDLLSDKLDDLLDETSELSDRYEDAKSDIKEQIQSLDEQLE